LPAPITVQNQVTKEAWDAESEPFKNEILASLENEHKAAIEAYEIAVSGEEPKTPEDFQIALNNAAFYLQPFINVVADHFGMNASLVMCGPVPNRGGAIEIHSVHTGMS
ncbi:hypothetical protein B0H13DRAFT_1447067, partial [Mycena leptocephala]